MKRSKPYVSPVIRKANADYRREVTNKVTLPLAAAAAAGAIAVGMLASHDAPPKPKQQVEQVIDFSKYPVEHVKVQPNQNPYDIIDEVETGLTPDQELQLANNLAEQGSVIEADGVTHEFGPGDVVNVAIVGQPRK